MSRRTVDLIVVPILVIAAAMLVVNVSVLVFSHVDSGMSEDDFQQDLSAGEYVIADYHSLPPILREDLAMQARAMAPLLALIAEGAPDELPANRQSCFEALKAAWGVWSSHRPASRNCAAFERALAACRE